jgi:hypothetical protein
MKKKFSDLPADWKDIILNLMIEGSHVTNVLKNLGISRGLHNRYYEENEDYRDTIDKGKLLSEAWWTEQGRSNIANKNFNNTIFIFMMKAVFRWKDTYPSTKEGDTLAGDDEKAALRDKYRSKETEQSESLQ